MMRPPRGDRPAAAGTRSSTPSDMNPDEQRPDLEHFRKLVLADPGLLDQLRAAGTDEAFITLAIRLGRERGCVFTPAVVEAALREQRRVLFERWV